LRVGARAIRCGKKIAKDAVKFNVPEGGKTRVDFPLSTL
jgi:hypothetical protein